MSDCDGYHVLFSGSTLERFLWVIQFYVGNGFYVAIDFHPLAGDPNPNNTELFVQNWRTLWQAIVGLPTFEQHLKCVCCPEYLEIHGKTAEKWIEFV